MKFLIRKTIKKKNKYIYIYIYTYTHINEDFKIIVKSGNLYRVSKIKKKQQVHTHFGFSRLTSKQES